MCDKIPEWITNLALDTYKVIQQYNAMPRFQDMVQTWAKTQEEEIQKHITWGRERNQHFEKTVRDDPRLRDKQAGPPKDNWQWETYVIHPYEKTESGLQRTDKIISAWVPPQLSISAEPEITHLLPLTPDHELSLGEKYAVVGAIYNLGSKGTPQIAPWPWPGPNEWDKPGALSNAKKSIFFEALRNRACDLAPDIEGWLRSFLDDVVNDLTNTKNVPQQKVSIGTAQMDTVDIKQEWERYKRRHKKLPPRDRLFISYSRKDKKWLVDIVEGLVPIRKNKDIDIWTDDNIEPGQKWPEQIKVALDAARVALLLVSRSYLASDFINNEELPYLLKAASEEKLEILWVLIGACMWEETKLKDVQAVTDPKCPLNNLSEGERDLAIKIVCEAIRDTFPTQT